MANCIELLPYCKSKYHLFPLISFILSLSFSPCKRFFSYFGDFSLVWSYESINHTLSESLGLSEKRRFLTTLDSFWVDHMVVPRSILRHITTMASMVSLSPSSGVDLLEKIHSFGSLFFSRHFFDSFHPILDTWFLSTVLIILEKWISSFR